MLGALLSALATIVHAEDCANAVSQADITNCAIQAYRREDTLLNRNYNTLMGKIDKAQQEGLRAAQRAWIEFRDLNCKFVADSAGGGGTIAAAIQNGCLAELTKTRAADLARMADTR